MTRADEYLGCSDGAVSDILRIPWGKGKACDGCGGESFRSALGGMDIWV